MFLALEAVFCHMAKAPREDSGETYALLAQKHFQRMDPPTFKGDDEVIKAEMERIFKSLQKVDDDLRMATTPFYLRRKATGWWKSQEEVFGLEGITWAAFCKVYLDEFFP